MACTSAIVSGKLTRDGRPILWKNRDTSHLVNYVASKQATDSTHAYVALYNSDDTDAHADGDPEKTLEHHSPLLPAA